MIHNGRKKMCSRFMYNKINITLKTRWILCFICIPIEKEKSNKKHVPKIIFCFTRCNI